MPQTITPVEALNITPQMLDIHEIRGDDHIRTTKDQDCLDYLTEVPEGYRLHVQYQERFQNLRATFGETAKGSLNERKAPHIEIVRCHPSLFRGLTFRTGNSTYQITDDLRIRGREEIEGSRIELAGAIPPSLYTCAGGMLAGSDLWTEFIQKFSGYMSSGMHLALKLTDEDQKRTGKVGLLTGMVTRIR